MWDLSIVVNGILKSLIIIVLLLISPLIAVSICLIFCSVPMLGAYIFLVVFVFFIDSSFDHYLLSLFVSSSNLFFFLSLFYLIWVLQFLLSFDFHLHGIIFSQPFNFSLYVSLGLRWLSCRQQIQMSCFCIHPFNQTVSFGWRIYYTYN